MKHSVKKIAYGDFQTPPELAVECCQVVQSLVKTPTTVIEPTCGQGAFVAAAAESFSDASVVGYEINDEYRQQARRNIRQQRAQLEDLAQVSIRKQDFFAANWDQIRQRCSGPVLFLGNPPWVTHSQLGSLQSKNLPQKSNHERVRGIDAMTGRSNFDISESMLQTLLQVMRPDEDSMAMLVKTATARKVVRSHWESNKSFSHASIHPIDAKQMFGVSVDACLLVLSSTTSNRFTPVCRVSADLGKPANQIAMGWHDGKLVTDPKLAARTAHLEGDAKTDWRSGIKHDVSRVLELSQIDGAIVRQDGSHVDVEPDRLFPLAKGADVANDRVQASVRRLLVPQKSINEDTSQLKKQHPKTYRYLDSHRDAFAARKSSIYRDRDRFALFGIGPYTFAPYKIAICGLYKRLQFTLIGPIKGQPVVMDDTCYFLSLKTKRQAVFVLRLLTSAEATEFFQARIFWDAKRPITADVLRRLDLRKLAQALNCESEYEKFWPQQAANH